MNKYIRYARSLITHKWLVLIECCRSGIPFQGLTHDLSKFLPSELLPYASYYGRTDEELASTSLEEEAKLERALSRAWNLHQKRNSHHWQYWVLTRDDGGHEALEMTDRKAMELICDWRAFGHQYGKSAPVYYRSVCGKINLSDETRELLEGLLDLEESGRRRTWLSLKR